ncbi:VTT domain-containing protein [Oenococcus sp.]|uniref:VTT domain-containing protein n=1 Tax=Oenococcus sp. TaxID=1979414 RepID=UPI0039E89912
MATALFLNLLNVNKLLPGLMGPYSLLIYSLLFLIIFVETGLVFVPFLPGDSILFLSGSLAALDGGLNLPGIICGFIIAAILGDFVNFELGRHFGQRITKSPRLKKLIKEKSLKASERFYAKYGKAAIFLGRFVPIVRTIVPFTAGMSRMPYRSFSKFNIIGAVSWILIMTLSGFFWGNIPVVKNNFQFVMIAIIVISLLPIFLAQLRAHLAAAKSDGRHD